MSNMNNQMKLPMREKVGYAFGDFACCLIWQSISVYLLYYFTNSAGVPSDAAIRIISASKIIDGVTDILMGVVIDRTKSRLGHVRPYLLTMGLPLAASTVLLFSIPAGFSQEGKLLWIAIWYNMVTSVFYTALNVPYSSMQSFLSDDSDERSQLSLIRLIFAFSSMILVNAFVFSMVRGLGNGQLNSQKGWTWTIVIIAALSFVLTLVTFFFTKERVSPPVSQEKGAGAAAGQLKAILKNRFILILYVSSMISFVNSALSSSVTTYYAKYALNDVDLVGALNNATMIAQVICMLFIMPFLLKRWSKSVLYICANAILVLCYIATGVFARNATAILVVNAMKGLAFASTVPLMFAMCADAIDYGEWKSGISMAGLGNAVLQCCSKIGLALGTALLGIVLNIGGFDALAEVQTDSGLQALIQGYAWIPAIFSAMIVLVMTRYKLDKIYPTFIEDLRARRLNNKN